MTAYYSVVKAWEEGRREILTYSPPILAKDVAFLMARKIAGHGCVGRWVVYVGSEAELK